MDMKTIQIFQNTVEQKGWGVAELTCPGEQC